MPNITGSFAISITPTEALDLFGQRVPNAPWLASCVVGGRVVSATGATIAEAGANLVGLLVNLKAANDCPQKGEEG